MNYKENLEEVSDHNNKDLGLAEIMEMVENGLTPPGIKFYDDMPSSEIPEGSKSLLTKKTKPWLENPIEKNIFEISPDVETKFNENINNN